MRLDDLINTTLGRYQIEALIGRGGMAAVYRAFDPALQRQVALKVLYPQYLADADLVERFRREAITAAKLDHPNIAPIYDVGEANGLVYLALKLLPGASLADVLQQAGHLPPARVGELAVEIAAALDEAHRHGIVHRDIKPGNVLFDGRGRAVLTDFGIAKSLDVPSMTGSSVIVGTPDYIAPEQIDPQLAVGGVIDGRADIYAFGGLLYRALTGQRPFGGSGQAVLLAHLRDLPPAPSSIVPSLPSAVDTVLAAAMAKNPLDRPATAGAIAAALLDALGDATAVGTIFPPAAVRQTPHARQTTAVPQPVQPGAVPSAAVPPAPAHVPRNRSLIALVTCGLLLAFGAVLLAWIMHRPPGGEPAVAAERTTTGLGGVLVAATHTPTLASATATGTIALAAGIGTATATVSITPVTPSATLVPVTPSVAGEPAVVLVPPTTAVQPRPTSQPITVPVPTPQPLPSATVPPPTATRVPPTAVRPTPRPPTPVPPTSLPPTVRPPTAVPPTATPAELACAATMQGGFGALWKENAAVRRSLGCPLAAEAATHAAEQLFQHGLMYWVAANQRIYVLTPAGSGGWSAYPNTYQDGEQLSPLDLPPGCVEPVRGFGKLWRNELAVSDALGCGVAPEQGMTGVYQRFEGGTMLYSQQLNGHGPRIYVLLSNHTYTTYADPS